MTIFRYVLFLAVMAVASPVWAGQVTYADSRGKWESTQCKPPEAMAAFKRDSEAAANDLNGDVNRRNAYIAQAQDYMNCLSQEAHKDATATGYLITETAKQMIEEVRKSFSALGPSVQTSPEVR